MPFWLADDLLHYGSRQMASVAWRKVRNLCQRFRGLWGHAGRGVRGEADNAFDRTRIPDPFWRVLERHYESLGRYAPKPYPGRVTLFRARTRPLFRLHGPDLGWAKLACGGLDVRTVPGNHDSILKEPYVGALAAALQEELWQAQVAENPEWRTRPVVVPS